jgi:alkylhydroperoxidase family enzyme
VNPADVTTWLPSSPDETPGSADLLALLPAGYDELRALYAGLWESGIDPVTLELCRLRMSTIIRSEPGRRDPRAVAAGLDDRLVSALPSWPTSELFSPAQRAALGFAEQYVLDPRGFTDADAAAMHEHFTPEQLATLTTAVATFDALTRVRALLTVDADHTDLPVRHATFGADLTSKEN